LIARFPGLSRRTILIGSTATVGALELYSRFPRPNVDMLNPLPLPAASPKQVTVVFHGAGGQDEYTKELMERLGKVSRATNIIARSEAS